MALWCVDHHLLSLSRPWYPSFAASGGLDVDFSSECLTSLAARIRKNVLKALKGKLHVHICSTIPYGWITWQGVDISFSKVAVKIDWQLISKDFAQNSELYESRWRCQQKDISEHKPIAYLSAATNHTKTSSWTQMTIKLYPQLTGSTWATHRSCTHLRVQCNVLYFITWNFARVGQLSSKTAPSS